MKRSETESLVALAYRRQGRSQTATAARSEVMAMTLVIVLGAFVLGMIWLAMALSLV